MYILQAFDIGHIAHLGHINNTWIQKYSSKLNTLVILPHEMIRESVNCSFSVFYCHRKFHILKQYFEMDILWLQLIT